MHSKDKKEYTIVTSLTRNVMKDFDTVNKLFKEYVKKTFGKGVVAFIEPDNYGSANRYRFCVRFKDNVSSPKETETSLRYIAKWVITDCKIEILKRTSRMYGFFAAKHKLVNGLKY